jgi:hypothetical protein
VKNSLELRKINPKRRINFPKQNFCVECGNKLTYTPSRFNYYKNMKEGKIMPDKKMPINENLPFVCVPCARQAGFTDAQETRRDNPNIPAWY